MGWELYSLSEGKISHRNRNLTRGPSTQAQVEHAELIYRHLRLKKKNSTIIIHVRKYIP